MVSRSHARTPRSRTQIRARVRSRLRAWRNRARGRIVQRRRFQHKGLHHFNRYETVAASEQRAIQLIGGSGGDPTFTTEALDPFVFNKLTGYTDFINMYQSYRINKVVVQLIWGNDQVVQGGVSTSDPNEVPGTAQTLTSTRNDPLEAITCYMFRDYDGAPSLLNGENAFRERQGVKRFSMKRGRAYNFTITPAARSVMWQAGPTLPGGNPTFATGRKYKQWMNMTMNSGSGVAVDGTTIPLYGMQLGFKHPSPSADPANPRYGRVTCAVKYYFSCKGVS